MLVKSPQYADKGQAGAYRIDEKKGIYPSNKVLFE